MKTSVTFLLFTALAGVVSAGTPIKPPLQTYHKLWDSSPFTTKPAPPPPGQEDNIFDDYALLGVSPIGEGNFRVTMMNKKKPDDRVMVYSDAAGSDFKILGVTRKDGNPLGTVVSMASGSQTGTVRFDEKLLVPVKPQPTKVQPGQNPPGATPVPQPVPRDAKNPATHPRRVVAPSS